MRADRRNTWAIGITLCFVWTMRLAAQESAGPPVTLRLDFESAEGTVRLFQMDSVPDTEIERVFRLPGVRALYDQARRFDDDATEAVFESSLRAALRGEPVSPDPFNFSVVRDRLGDIVRMIDWIEANHEELAADLARRIAEYSPPTSPLEVPVYMVVGGSSDGWAREGTFHVALQYFRDDLEGLKLLMAHELFHVAQSAFMAKSTVPEDRVALYNVERLVSTTVTEGSASLLSWPVEATEGGVYAQRFLFEKRDRNQNRIAGLFALFDVMVLGMYADPEIDLESVYNIGFSGIWDSPLYYLGYHVARTVEEARGREFLRDLLARPPVELFQSYVSIYRERPDDEGMLRFSPEVEKVLAELAGFSR